MTSPTASETPLTDALVVPRLDFTNDESVRDAYKALAEHARELERALAGERRKALEEAAKVCEQPKPECCGSFVSDDNALGPICCGRYEPGEYMDGPECAATIRALLSQPETKEGE